jgi:hypothetical protein
MFSCLFEYILGYLADARICLILAWPKRAKRAAVMAERRESTETSGKMTLHTKQIAILKF